MMFLTQHFNVREVVASLVSANVMTGEHNTNDLRESFAPEQMKPDIGFEGADGIFVVPLPESIASANRSVLDTASFALMICPF